MRTALSDGEPYFKASFIPWIRDGRVATPAKRQSIDELTPHCMYCRQVFEREFKTTVVCPNCELKKVRNMMMTWHYLPAT